MEERHRPNRPTVFDVNQMTDAELVMSGIFTPDEEYFTPTTVAATTTTTQSIPTTTTVAAAAAAAGEQSTYSKNEYQPRTLKSYNKVAREAILPIFPPRSTLVAMIKQRITAPPPPPTTTTTVVSTVNDPKNSNEEVDFLLCNVPKHLLTMEQYQRRQMNVYIPSFELRTWDEIRRTKNYHSYMLTFYDNIYVKLSKQWHIDLPVLDTNLARLRQCEIKHGFQFSFDDLPLALEFFLQIDIDLFHLKTCTFRQAQPRVIVNKNGQRSFEGIFANDQQSIEGRYGFTPCNRNNCLCCKNQSTRIQFSPKQIHCFLNQYKAILNCPVTCKTSNIIYALTCPCGEKDYVAHTNLSFVDCLSYHRREIVRSIYEFLIGDLNVDLIELKPKSEEKKTNDANWLYQHAARCPVIMQLFLDCNPLYWCFVPVPKDLTLRASIYARPAPAVPLSPSAQITTTIATLPMVRRSDTLAMRLANNIPKPADINYIFTHEQFNQQKLFFKYGRDRDPVNIHNLRFYNATIVAVLPDHCSNTVKKFIESLFITHGECQLNKDGRLINQHFSHIYPSRGHWYRGLIHPRSSSIASP